MTIKVVLLCFISTLSHSYLVIGNEWVSKIKICKCFVSNQTNISNFQRLEIMGRGSRKTFWKCIALNVRRVVKLFHILKI